MSISMKTTVVTSLALMALMPAAALANEVYTGVAVPPPPPVHADFSAMQDQILSQVINNVSSFSESSVSTGGVHVSGSAVSTGSSSASVMIRNYIHDGNGTGTVDAEIRTNEDGIVHTQTVHKDIVPGVPLDIRLGTTTPGDGAQTHSEIRVMANATNSAGELVWHEATDTQDRINNLWQSFMMGTSADTHIAPLSRPSLFGEGGIFSSFFSHPFGFFGLW